MGQKIDVWWIEKLKEGIVGERNKGRKGGKEKGARNVETRKRPEEGRVQHGASSRKGSGQ